MVKRKRSYKRRSYKKRKPKTSKIVYVEAVDIPKASKVPESGQPEVFVPGTVIVDEVKE